MNPTDPYDPNFRILVLGSSSCILVFLFVIVIRLLSGPLPWSVRFIVDNLLLFFVFYITYLFMGPASTGVVVTDDLYPLHLAYFTFQNHVGVGLVNKQPSTIGMVIVLVHVLFVVTHNALLWKHQDVISMVDQRYQNKVRVLTPTQQFLVTQAIDEYDRQLHELGKLKAYTGNKDATVDNMIWLQDAVRISKMHQSEQDRLEKNRLYREGEKDWASSDFTYGPSGHKVVSDDWQQFKHRDPESPDRLNVQRNPL